MEWEVVDESEIPPPPEPCKYIGKHTYMLSVDEGKLSLTPYEKCTGECWLPDFEDLFGEDIVHVSLRFRRECLDERTGRYSYGHGYGSCDCNIWYELEQEVVYPY
jgi:hypothetical protein